MNILAYVIYLLVTYLVTVHVGLVFYRNGRVFILAFLKGDERLADFINRMLLTGYYLLNLGYAALMLQSWDRVDNWAELVCSIGTMTGKILLTLGVMHFGNMGFIYIYGKHYHIHHSKV